MSLKLSRKNRPWVSERNSLPSLLLVPSHSIHVLAGSYVHPHRLSRPDEQRYFDFEPVFQRCFLEGAVLLGMDRRRGGFDFRLDDLWQHDADRLAVEELDRNLYLWSEEFLRAPDHVAGNLDVLERDRIHEGHAVVAAVEKLHVVAFELEIFQSLLGAKVLVKHSPAMQVAERRLHHSTHFGGAGFRLDLQHLIDLSFEADDHSSS